MSTESTLTARQQIIDMLSGDLNAQGWNQSNKLWFVKGDVDDEWLEFVETFTGAPENHLVQMISKGDKAEDVNGLVIATEGWTYPPELMATFKSEQALRSFWRLSPPDKHPNRIELRQLLFVHKDGEVINLVVHNADIAKKWASMDAETKCPTGDRTIDAARGFLGINEAIVSRIRSTPGGSPLDAMQKISGVMQQALSGQINPDEATLGIFNSMPEQVRIEMVKQMPDQIKETLRRLLTPEEQQKYGL
jgi:hypothetical protein